METLLITETTIESDIVATAVRQLMKESTEWTGTMSELSEELSSNLYITALGLACWDRGMRGDPTYYGGES